MIAIIVFASFVSNIFGSPLQGQVSKLARVPNPCNTLEGTLCVFPFKYDGVEYFQCTYAASPVPWCATKVDPNGTVVVNNWGDCANTATSSCPSEDIDVPECLTQGGPQDNTACIFPFRHQGVTYTSCATTDDKEMAWCSTNTTTTGEHVEGFYGFCPSSCPGGENNTSTTSTTTTTSTTSTTSTSTASTSTSSDNTKIFNRINFV